VSRQPNSLIRGKIQAISVEGPLPAWTIREAQGLFRWIPCSWNREFLSANRECIAPTRELRMSACCSEADVSYAQS
jgi:hypothetical protein